MRKWRKRVFAMCRDQCCGGAFSDGSGSKAAAGRNSDLSDLYWQLLIIPLCVAGWIVFSYLLSYLSGWRFLAQAYRATQPFSGRVVRPWAASMRWGVNYNGLIAIGMNSMGIHLSAFFLFRVGHPPIFIPWSEISASRQRRWWFKLIRLQFERYPSTYLLIPLNVAEKLSRESGGQFPLEELHNNLLS